MRRSEILPLPTAFWTGSYMPPTGSSCKVSRCGRRSPDRATKLPIQNRTRTVYRRVNKEAGQTQPGYLRVYDPGPPLGNFTKAMAKNKNPPDCWRVSFSHCFG